MKNLWNFLTGLSTAVITTLIVIGGVSLALAEGIVPTLAPTQSVPEQMMPTFAILSTQVDNQILPIFTSAPTATVTATIVKPTTCPPPKGWQAYTIQIGDTLETIANRTGVSQNRLSQANCLFINTLLPNTILYVPAPTATPTITQTHAPLPSYTSIPCGPPAEWVRYSVKPNDTLYKLSMELGVSIFQLQIANCFGNSQFIVPGETLFVPFIPNMPVVSQTFTVTPHPTAVMNTQMPVLTSTPTLTKTLTENTPQTNNP